MADINFNQLTEKLTNAVSWDQMLIQDSEDSEIIKRIEALKFKWPKGDTGDTWPTWPQWPQGEKGDKGDKGEDGINWTWEYNWATTYQINDAVSYQGSSYIATQLTTWNIPTDVTYWDLLAQKGESGSWTWDMLASVYDPNTKQADVYSMGNMDETADKKILTEQERYNLETNIATGWLKWCELTTLVGGTTFDISSWVYRIADLSDIDNPNIVEINYAWSTGNADTFLWMTNFTYVFLDINWNIFLKWTTPSVSDLRDKYFIGRTVHFSSTWPASTYTSVGAKTRVPAFWTSQTANEEKFERWSVSVSWNTVELTTTSFTKSVGKWDRLGINFDDKTSPNTITMIAKTFGDVDTFYTRTSTTPWEYIFETPTWIDATLIDDWDGTTSPVTSNRWSNQYVYAFPWSDAIVVTRGAVSYVTQSAAQSGIMSETKYTPDIASEWILLWVMTLRWGWTDFSSPSDWLFTELSKLYWIFGIWGGAGWGAQDLQDVYNVSTPTAEIKTNATNWAVSIEWGTWVDTDNNIEIKNNAGTTTATIQANGIPTKGTDLITKTYADANYAWGGGWSVTTLDTLEITGTQYTGVVSSYRVGQSGTLAKFSAYLETAPTGSNFTVDLKINGTTQATATITAGTNSGTTTSFTSSTLTEGDLVTYEITQIGSSVAGSNLTLILNLS